MAYSPSHFDALDDNFIRTTMKCHISFVQDIWRKIVKNGWLYEGNYEGWYCVSDEAYYSEDELITSPDGSKKTELGKSVEWKSEKTYFFRLSEFQDVLLKMYDGFPQLIRPLGKKGEVVSFVSGLQLKEYENGVPPKKNYLKDLSVSRNNFNWGIKIPCDLDGNDLLDSNGDWKQNIPQDKRHVIYVWFDALFNYLTALGDNNGNDYKNYWANSDKKVHIIGKDILRPHAVYWPAFLLAIHYTRDQIKAMKRLDEGVKTFIPSTIFAHGWLTNEGLKISKSLGNAIIPSKEIEWLESNFAVSCDVARDYLKYYLIVATPFGNDGDYSRLRLVEKINGDLANKIGNLVKRCMDMIYKNYNEEIPTVGDFDDIYILDCKVLLDYFENFDIGGYVELIIKVAESANKYMDEKTPWNLQKEGKIDEAKRVLYSLANVIKNIAILLQPICPYIASTILHEIGFSRDCVSFGELGSNIKSATKIQKPTIVIPRLQTANG